MSFNVRIFSPDNEVLWDTQLDDVPSRGEDVVVGVRTYRVHRVVRYLPSRDVELFLTGRQVM